MCKCLYCYKPLKEGERDMHTACAKKFFGTREVPKMDYSKDQLDELALQIIHDKTSLTGVQPKLSLHLQDNEGTKRLTIVGLWGGYICKPQTPLYQQMPEVEDLTMHLAELCKIDVVPHSLMRMADGSICYLSKRIDRDADGCKIAMEDMCQLTERQTEYKYRSSYERVGKTIGQYSSMPKMDIINFFEMVLFSWITGNNDMHLKNFSLWEPADGSIRLSPAYDLLNAAIINIEDNEETALTLNGKKKRINKTDFLSSAKTMGIDCAVVNKLIAKYVRLKPAMEQLIRESFLTEELKEKYTKLVNDRIAILNITE